MKFIDEIEIRVRGGHGGPGSVHFLREKYRPHGGPDGGDGGDGGSVYLETHDSTESLGHFLRKSLYKAENGEEGHAKNRSGKHGNDLILRVPGGTQVVDSTTGEQLVDLFRPGMRVPVAHGGKGGQGNQHFANSVEQAPEYAQPGLPGEERLLTLTLKLLADAGLVGLPNAGKSTLLRAVSGSDARVGDYPFTTLTPNLGVVENGDYRRLLLADIPGIIEGAHRGAGLGLAFLRHIERVRLIIYVIDMGSLDPVYDLQMLRSELSSYSEEILRRPVLIVLNKYDQAKYDPQYASSVKELVTRSELWSDHTGGSPPCIFLSALEKQGIEEFINTLFDFFPEQTFAEEVLKPADESTELSE